MVATYQVDLKENRSTRELRGKVLDVWQRIAVGRRDVIEASVVATRSPTAGVLRYHVQGRRPRTVWPSYDPHIFHLSELLFGVTVQFVKVLQCIYVLYTKIRLGNARVTNVVNTKLIKYTFILNK